MPEVIASDNPFSAREREVLRGVAGALIPASDEYGIPGADDEEIFARILALAAARAESIKSGIAALNALAGDHGNQDFLDLSDPRQAALLRDEASSSFLKQMIHCTATSYYQDGRVLESIDLKSTPPFPGGHEIEQGDWTLLDPVKARTPFYRRVEKA